MSENLVNCINDNITMGDLIVDIEFEDLDITDKTILQEQFNTARHNYMRLLKQSERLENDSIAINEQLMRLRKAALEDPNINNREISSYLASQEEFIEATIKKEVLERTNKILTEQINYVKNDIRILTNSMYNRF